jgi:hypothetical protein
MPRAQADVMGRPPLFRRIACAAMVAVTGSLAAGCVDVSYDDPPSGGPPAPAFVWIDSSATVVYEQTIYLRGEAECDDCPPATGWQPMQCPAIACPESTRVDVHWTNRTTGATGPTTHGITSACHCPLLLYGYCYSACNHIWWAFVPLAFGENRIEVAATVPGIPAGTATRTIERVPEAPAWLASQADPGQITLSWPDVAGATSYNLYWSTTAWAYSSLCENRIEDVTSPYTHTGVASGVTYYYYVTASSGGAESFDSPALAVTPP